MWCTVFSKIYCHPIIELEVAHNSNKKLIIGPDTAGFAQVLMLRGAHKYSQSMAFCRWEGEGGQKYLPLPF